MSQFSNGVVLQEMSLKTNPVIDTYGSVRAESDLFSTLVLNAGPGTIGYNTGLGFPTFTGLAAKSLAQGMFERDIASPAAAYYKDVPSNLTGDPKPMLAWYESTFPEIRKMKEETGFSFDGHNTAEDAYEAMALAYGNWKSQQYYSDPFSSGSSVAVGIASLGIEILGDPTTWIGVGLGKLAVQKAAAKVVGKSLATQLGRVAAEGAVTNAVQTFAQSVAGQQQRYDLWGVVPDGNIDTTAMIAGGLFGAMLPVSIAGGIHGLGSGLDASARYIDKNLGNPDSFVNKVARMAGAPVLRNEPIDHLTGLGVAAENAEMVAGTHKYLYSDVTGNSVLEIALTKDYWDEVANTGIDAKQYAAWGLRSKPSQDEAMAFLEGLMDEAQRIRDAEANGGQSPAVAKANKDLQEVTLKVDNAFVDVEDPEIANRGTAWALVNFKKSLVAGGAAPDVAAEQAQSILAMIAAKAATKDMGTDEWIARNIKNFTIDKHPKTGEILFSTTSGDIFYRGDTQPLGDLDISQAKQVGVSLTTNKSVAESYGSNVSSYAVDSSKVFDPSSTVSDVQDLASRILQLSDSVPTYRLASTYEEAVKVGRTQSRGWFDAAGNPNMSPVKIPLNDGSREFSRALFEVSAWLRDLDTNNFFAGVAKDRPLIPIPDGRALISKLKELLAKEGVQLTDELERKFLTGLGYTTYKVGSEQIFVLDPSAITRLGDTLAQTNKGVVQAAVSFSPVDGRAIIRAFTGATNFSSMVHEIGHVFRRDLDPDQLAAANRWVGAEAGAKWTTKQEEQFARGFEKWLRGRKNTGSPMDGVFQKMKNWMLEIYKTIKGSPLDHVRLNEEIVNVFESMFRKTDPGQYVPKGTEGWKLHVDGSKQTLERLSAFLQERGIRHKIGKSSGQSGKGATIYIGDKKKAKAVAEEISSTFGDDLFDPRGDVLIDDTPFAGKVMGRFDIGSVDKDFHQYGGKGIPWLNSDMDPYNRRDPGLAAKDADQILRRRYGTFYTGEDIDPVLGTVNLTTPASGPPVAKFGLGRVKLRIAGDVERALFALHKAKTRKDRYALVAFLRKHTGMSDNEILTASRFVWSEVRSKVREAKSKLRATNRPADVRVDTNGSPYVVVELGDLKKIYDPEELGAMRFKEKFSNIGAPTTIETLQAELAAIRSEQAKLEYSDDAEKIAAVRKMKNKAARKLAHAVEKFFPHASGRTGSAAVVGDIDSGIVEKTAGTKLDSTETARVMLDGARKGNMNGDWLVFNSTRAIKTLRKVGNFFSTGHLETVGSDNPIVAKLARLVSEGIIYRDAFGPTKFKAIGLEQHRHRVKAMAGEAIREIEAVLKDVDPAIHQEVTKMAVARASGATYAGLSDPAATSAAEAMAAIYTKIYNRFGVEGIQNGYFRNTIDNYGGTFHILGTKRKASELADALYSVWREHFTKEDSPIHRRTFKSIPSITLEAYPQGGPKVLADLLPDDRAKYLKALLDESVRDGIYTSGLKREAQLVANNKLGFTELKELIVDDSLGLVHSDPSLSRQINVDVWFDPRVSGFVDWDPYGNIQKYLEITGYRVKEQTDINKVVKELLGYDRRDVDAIGLVRGIRDLLLSDDKLVDADREILKQSFQYLENQVNVLRSHVNRDYSRQMGAMDTVANVTMNLGRTGVSARSAMAGLSTEIIPMLLATTFRHPKNILPILKSTLQGLSKWQLKGLMAGYSHMFTHRPDVLNHVADIPSINHSWLDKTFINPYKQLKAAGQTGDATKTRIGNILTSATSMLHRMSSGLGGEDFFQKMATNVAAMQTTYRIADKFEKMKKLAVAMDGYKWSDDVTVREKQFRKLAYDSGFGEDPAWAAKLNQAGLLEKDFVSAMDAINTASDGRLLNDPNGAFDQNLIERIIGTNAENSRFYEAMNDRLLRFVEADIKTRVTAPGVQDSNIPAGGLDPITRMAQMFMSFQRSWFHHVLLNGVSNSKLQYGLSFLGTMLVGELIYYHAYRMLYRGDSWEDLEKEWTENPSVMIAEGVARTNLFGSASAIGQHVLDIVSDSGAARGGSIYSLKVAGNLFQSSVNLTKAALGKEDVDPADARRIELMTGGLNAWWVRPLMQATGYDSFSEWIFKDQPAG